MKNLLAMRKITESEWSAMYPTPTPFENFIIHNHWIVVLFILLIVTGILFLILKYFLPWLARYSGTLVREFKKGLDSKSNK
jgi:antibiotic biosynthesis monooxygenase (ABM) superfamily enzyme